MKLFFINIWKYLAFLFAGIIAGMVAAIKLIERPGVQNVVADTYIAQQAQKIGKLKQRGEGNSQMTSMLAKPKTGKEKRLARRAVRRESRLIKQTQSEEQEQKDY
jgi:hypothetical protein